MPPSLKIVLAAVLAAAPASALVAPDPAPIDAIVAQRLAQGGPPGFALAILRGDEPPLVRTYGMAELEQSVPVRTGSIFPIASITKTFTALAIMLLQEQGKVRVTDPLARWLPDFPGAGGITLRDLLVHTSGIAEFTRLEPFASDQQRAWTPQQLVGMVAAAPPASAPGTVCAYNDSGYLLLGLVVERASGRPFEAFVRERITMPLEMPTVALGSRRRLIPGRVAGYVRDGDTWQNAPADSLSAPWSAGGLMAGAGDLVLLAKALRADGPLLRPDSHAQMLAPVELADGRPCRLDLPGAEATYGFGLELVRFDDFPADRAIGKSGVFPGYSSYFAWFEGTDLAVAGLANADDSLPFTVETVHDVAKLLLAGER